MIRRGAADVVFGGGTEAGISLLGLSGFAVMRALTTRNDVPEEASRPFDADRGRVCAFRGGCGTGYGADGTCP